VENVGVDGRIIIEKLQFYRKRFECVDWIHLAHYTNHWQILVNMLMKFGIP
jgi:hypothetical protein